MPEHNIKRMPKDTRGQKYLWNGQDKSIQRELDPIRSTKSGINLQLSTVTQGVILSTPSNKTLDLQTLIMNNESAAAGNFTIYDSTGTTTPIFKATVGANGSLILTDLTGLKFTTGIYVVQGSTFIGSYTAGVIEYLTAIQPISP